MIQGSLAVYIAFGEGLGWFQVPPNSGNYQLLDVHGAGTQRADFKSGDPADYPNGFGPQGDVVRIDNFVRPVRDLTPAPEPSSLLLAAISCGVFVCLLAMRRRMRSGMK